eukprot:s1228_g10.t1
MTACLLGDKVALFPLRGLWPKNVKGREGRVEPRIGRTEYNLSRVPPAVARAIVGYSCGVSRPFADCTPSEARTAWALLQTGALPGEAADEGDVDYSEYVPESPKRERPRSNEKEEPGLALGFSASALLPLAMVGASMAAYRPVLDFNMETGGFFMDDVMIRRNSVVVDTTLDLRRLWTTDYWGLEMFDPNTWTHKSFRPLTVLTFRWNYWAHGFGNCGFHLTNALLHGLCSLQLAIFGRQACGLPWAWAALLAALFATHPVHTESICYVVGRADIVCAQVLFLATQLYAPLSSDSSPSQSKAWLRLLFACLLVVTAGLCKETGFTFFGFLVIWEVLALLRGRLGCGLQRLLRVLALLVIGSAACVARVWYTSGTQIARMDPYSNPIAASEDSYVRLLSYALVHGMYVKLLAWPVFLCYDYSMDAVPLVQSLEDVRLLLPVAAAYGSWAVCQCILPLLP